MKRSLYVVAGFLCLGLGSVGIILPILPTVPFFLATVICFARSSEKLHRWFIGTNMYCMHVEPFLEKKGMTIRAKICVMTTLTVLMAIGFFMMGNAPIGRIILFIVWFGHMIFFSFRVKLIKSI